jgi:hypothetical protein
MMCFRGEPTNGGYESALRFFTMLPLASSVRSTGTMCCPAQDPLSPAALWPFLVRVGSFLSHASLGAFLCNCSNRSSSICILVDAFKLIVNVGHRAVVHITMNMFSISCWFPSYLLTCCVASSSAQGARATVATATARSSLIQ